MVYRYSGRVNPPAPFVTIQVSASATSQPINVRALLDTGTDYTAVPNYAVEYLRLEQVDSDFTLGVIGPGSYEPLFRTFILVENYPAHEVIANSFDLPYAILGRDVLNQYHITLDGPNQTQTIAR